MGRLVLLTSLGWLIGSLLGLPIVWSVASRRRSARWMSSFRAVLIGYVVVAFVALVFCLGIVFLASR